MLLISQKKASEECDEDKNVSDMRLLFTGALGGAAGIFTFMIILKYRLKNMPLMIFLPVFTALNVYIVILFFTGRFFNGI